MKPHATDIVDYLPGLRAYTTQKGVRVIEIDYWANPRHDWKWAAEMRPTFLSNKDWRREMERDWTSPAGEPYFPDFTLIGREKYVHVQRTFVEQWPVFRAFDFGRRRPACVWFQYSPTQDRVILYREFMPHDIGTHDFRDAVKFLSGQLALDALKPNALRWVEEYAARPTGGHCRPPWFLPNTHFMDIGGKEALQGQSNASDEGDVVARDIFAAGGINLIIVTPRVVGRNRIIDRLLQMKEDGWPGILIDPQCEECIAGFEGAWCYPMPTKAVPIPVKPRKDGHFENLLDALGYGVAGVVPEDTRKEAEQETVVDWSTGRPRPHQVEKSEGPNWHEVRRGGRR